MALDKYVIIAMIVAGLAYFGYNNLIDKDYIKAPERTTLGYEWYDENFNSTVVEDYIFNFTNDLRAEKNLPKLGRNKELDKLAKYHSENMVIYRFFSHTDNEGLDPTQRAEKFKIKAWVDKGNYLSGISENIGVTPWNSNVEGCGDTTHNYELALCRVQGWKESKGHYENILGHYDEIGIGASYDKSSGEVYFTQNFR